MIMMMMMMMMMMMINFFVLWLTNEKRLTLIPAETIARDPHHRQSPIHRVQGLRLSKTWV